MIPIILYFVKEFFLTWTRQLYYQRLIKQWLNRRHSGVPLKTEVLEGFVSSGHILTNEIDNYGLLTLNNICRNLENNTLTGSVPSELLERSNTGSFSLRLGENPGLCTEISCRKSNSKKLVIPLVASFAALFILLLLSGVFWRIRNRRNKSGTITNLSLYLSFYIHIYLLITLPIVKTFFCKVNSAPQTSPMAKSENKLLFTFADVIKMTNNFGQVLGKGGFGTVYHGFYDNLQVAVKLLSETSAQGFKEFRSEVL